MNDISAIKTDVSRFNYAELFDVVINEQIRGLDSITNDIKQKDAIF